MKMILTKPKHTNDNPTNSGLFFFSDRVPGDVIYKMKWIEYSSKNKPVSIDKFSFSMIFFYDFSQWNSVCGYLLHIACRIFDTNREWAEAA